MFLYLTSLENYINPDNVRKQIINDEIYKDMFIG